MSQDVSPQVIEAVRMALAHTDFKWRTIAGVAKETGLTQEMVQHVIAALADEVVRSRMPAADFSELYTTREHFRKSASLGERLLGVIKNRAD